MYAISLVFIYCYESSHMLFKRSIALTPITRRQNKRSRDTDDEPSFSGLMMMMTNQQMQEMHNPEAEQEDEREE